MNGSTDTLRRERIDAVLALAADHVPPETRPMVEGFAREYFRQIDIDDLAERSADDLCGALLSHWQFGVTRAAGRPKVRVLSPTVAEHGWASRHSVIEIVNDDMSFLVDSTAAEINRQGLILHLIVHPIFGVERAADGTLTSIHPRSEAPPDAPRESWMHIEVDRLVDGIRVRLLTRASIEDIYPPAATCGPPVQPPLRSPVWLRLWSALRWRRYRTDPVAPVVLETEEDHRDA